MRVIICAVVAIMLCHLSPCWAETSEEKTFSQLLAENDHLQSLDESLNRQYQFLLLNLNEVEKQTLLQKERAWPR